MEGSGLIDIRAMATVLGAGASARGSAPRPGPADQVAVSTLPGLGASLPTAGVILPMVEPERPWWLMPSLAVGGALLVTVVALLAVIMLQPTRTARARGATPVPGVARDYDTQPGSARQVYGRHAEPKTVAKPAPTANPRIAAPQVAPDPTTSKISRPVRQPRVQRRRPRRDAKLVSKPERASVRTRPNAPLHRPRSIAEILSTVGKPRPSTPTTAHRPARKPRLVARDIQGGIGRVMGRARACGRRFSTSGRVSVRVVVTGATGQVASVSPKGTHAASLTGRCVARALRSARFSPIARSHQSFYYTVILR